MAILHFPPISSLSAHRLCILPYLLQNCLHAKSLAIPISILSSLYRLYTLFLPEYNVISNAHKKFPSRTHRIYQHPYLKILFQNIEQKSRKHC